MGFIDALGVNKARLASALAGAGGELQKLTIEYERRRRKPGKVEALFNPNEITLSKSATWAQQRSVSTGRRGGSAIVQEFRGSEAETFSIELFFDTYESRSGSQSWLRSAMPRLPGVGLQPDATDVRQHTERVAKLAEVDQELHRPPKCHLLWGAFDIFTGVMTSVQQRFTLFLQDGTPVRATLTCSFAEATRAARSRATELHSADVTKTRQVRRNDTLHSLAAEEYNDPSLWRHIARANGIVNPRELQPGTVLTIPKLDPQAEG
jgi:nucleoid-associated protein YgaU